jgi:hypothetical protein
MKCCLIITLDKLTIPKPKSDCGLSGAKCFKGTFNEFKVGPSVVHPQRFRSLRLIKQLHDGFLKTLRHVSACRRQPCQIKVINQNPTTGNRAMD